MTLMHVVLCALYTAQAISAIRSYRRVRRGETILVSAPPLSPVYMLWAFGAIIGTAFAILAFLGALLAIFMVGAGATGWYLAPTLLVVGVLMALISRLSWRKLRTTQLPTKPAAQKPEASEPERWWTRRD
jgi:hypothetical protein